MQIDGTLTRDTHSDGYEIWRPDGHVDVHIGDNETIDGVLIEQDKSNTVSIFANGDNWVVRNVGWQGTPPHTSQTPYRFMLRGQVHSSDATGTIENVWMEGRTYIGGCYVAANHEGHIDIRNSYFGYFGNNSIYASGPGKHGSTGSVAIESCYSNSSSTGNFRIGTPGSSVRNSLVVIDDGGPLRAPYGDGSYLARPIEALHHPDQVAENCSVFVSAEDVAGTNGAIQVWATDWAEQNGHSAPGPELTVRGCDVVSEQGPRTARINGGSLTIDDSLGSSPTAAVLQNGGVPAEAAAAARGERSMPCPDQGVACVDGGGSTTDGSDGETMTTVADRVNSLEAKVEEIQARIASLEGTTGAADQCAAATADGTRCTRTAQVDSPTCWQHPESAAQEWG